MKTHITLIDEANRQLYETRDGIILNGTLRVFNPTFKDGIQGCILGSNDGKNFCYHWETLIEEYMAADPGVLDTITQAIKNILDRESPN